MAPFFESLPKGMPRFRLVRGVLRTIKEESTSNSHGAKVNVGVLKTLAWLAALFYGPPILAQVLAAFEVRWGSFTYKPADTSLIWQLQPLVAFVVVAFIGVVCAYMYTGARLFSSLQDGSVASPSPLASKGSPKGDRSRKQKSKKNKRKKSKKRKSKKDGREH